MIKFTVPHTLAFVLHTSTWSCAGVWAHWVRKGTTLILYVNFLEPAPTHTLLVFSGQLSREHSVVMSCSTFMTDGKCAACRALLLPSLLHSTSPSSPDHPSTQRRQHFNVSNERDVATRGGATWSWGSGKNASPCSSILQLYLVKANTAQHIPSCHWKKGSDTLAWHANIVTCTNDDAKLT